MDRLRFKDYKFWNELNPEEKELVIQELSRKDYMIIQKLQNELQYKVEDGQCTKIFDKYS